MKRYIAVALAVVLALTMFLVVGCKSAQTEEAKEVMTAGDEYYMAAQEAGDQLDAAQTEVMGALLQGTTPEITEEEITALEAMFDTVTDNVAKAREEYQKMSTLEGVDDYIEYAEQMIEACNIYDELMVKGKALYDQLKPVLEKMMAGEEVDLTALMGEMSGVLDEVTALQTDLAKAEDAAAQIKKDKGLGE